MSTLLFKNQLCPICNQTITLNKETIYIPFCSIRCKTIDLGNWLSDSYRIPVNLINDNEIDNLDNNSDFIDEYQPKDN